MDPPLPNQDEEKNVMGDEKDEESIVRDEGEVLLLENQSKMDLNEKPMRKQRGDKHVEPVIPFHKLPFPQRLWQSKVSKRESRFKKMLSNLEISMPFMEAVT